MAKILMIDSDEEFIDACRPILEAASHEVSSACNISDGETKVQTEVPDIIFLDVMLDAADDGVALLHTLRKKGVSIPVIMLSAVSQETGLQYGKCDVTLKCNDFLEKPVTAEKLIEKVNKVLSNQ